MKLTGIVKLLLPFLLIAAALPAAAEDEIPLPGDGTAVPLPGDDSGKTDKTGALNLQGYVENTTTVEYIKATEKEALLNATRARLNLSGKPSEHFDYGIGLVGILYAGRTNISLTQGLPAADAATINLPDLFTRSLEKEIFIQEAFVTLYMPHVRVRAGRHKFYTGNGFAFNPTDLFNRKNPLDPTYEVNGIDALLVALELPRNTEIQGLLHFSDNFSNTGYLGRVKTTLFGWDLAAQYTHVIKKRTDFEAFNTAAASLPVPTDPNYAAALLALKASASQHIHDFRWHFAGGEINGELFGVNLKAEGGYAWVSPQKSINPTLDRAAKSHERFLVGFDYTFSFQLYVMAEYLRIGQGADSASDISINDRFAGFAGETLAISRDTLFSGITYPITDLMDGAFYCITGLNDRSVILNPRIDWSVFSAVKIIFSVYVPLGKEESQAGRSGVSGFVRVKASF